MGKLYVVLSFFVVCLTIIVAEDSQRKNIVAISSGTSFGECLGYCRRSITLRCNGRTLIALKEPNGVDSAYPPVEKQYKISSTLWNELVDLVNVGRFRSLDDRIGCPDCADGGAEWIEIEGKNFKKRVTFEYNQSIEGFDALVKKLRELRGKYVAY